MKIQCDVCSKDEALLFCTADDAALCSACDHRLHHPNLLATNHNRFPLLHSNNNSNNHFPVCDICQERRAFLFCQQDRAILCKDCDLPIHSANQLTRNHQRFLLTGVKLSCVSASQPNFNSHPLPTNDSCVAESSTSTAPTATADAMNGVAEYLIETLPEWHFEEFLDSSSTTAPPPFGFSKLQSNDGDWVFPFVDAVVELETNPTDSLSLQHIQMELKKECGGGGSGSGSGGDSSLVSNIQMFLILTI